MTDLPPGKWSALLVGEFWPSMTSVTFSVNAARNRGLVKSFFEDFVRLLSTTRTGPLAPMEGVTAESIREQFRIGEGQASSVADKNGVKQKAFIDAAQALNGLRSDLTQIAAEGNSEIDQILQSNKNPAQKITEIINVITEKQGYAAHKSMQYGAEITGAVQRVLTAEGDTRTPAQFAVDNGLDLGNPPTPRSADTIRGAAESMFRDTTGGTADTRTFRSCGKLPHRWLSRGRIR